MSFDTPMIKRLRRRVRRRRFQQSAILGNESNLIYAGLGKVWVRFRGGMDANGNCTYAPAVKVNRGSAQFFEYPGAPVWVVYDRNDELSIEGVDSKEAAAAGLDTGLLNYGSKSSRWIRLKNVVRLVARPVGTTADPSTLVAVRSLIYDTDYGSLYRLEATARVADKVDLASYIPAAGYHAVVCIFLRTVENTFQVVSSTAQTIDTAIDLTDYQECFAQRDAETVPIQGFILGDAQTSVDMRHLGEDLRQFVNMPRALGFPNPVALKHILRAGYSQTVSDKLTITGKLTVEGKLTIAKTTCPTISQPVGPIHLPCQALHNSVSETTTTLSYAANIGGGICLQATPADAQIVFRSRSYLTPGVYKVRALYGKSSNYGKFKVSAIGPMTVTTALIDGYAAGGSYNNIADDNITITLPGEYRLDVITDGKNASSSDYYVVIQSITITKQ